MKTNIKYKNQLSDRIMRRVYFIWFSKRVLPYLAAEALLFSAFLYLIGQQVYVARVLEYATSVLTSNIAHPATFASFTMDLFVRTRVGVQISVIGSLVTIFFLFRNLISSAFQLTWAKETKLNNQML
ncbi:MAG: hypothetical protein Q7K16_01075 [Candidatus Azambacteria bacterium]|nr:hypothetical protein [Candidatus Azambacteria bacterium]